MRRRNPEHERSVVDDLSDLLKELPLTSIQRHWADEYLRDLRAGEFSPSDREELEELRDELRDLSWSMSRIRSLVE